MKAPQFFNSIRGKSEVFNEGCRRIDVYKRQVYDLITNQKVADGSRKLVEKKAAYGMASREKTIFDRLVAAGQRLVSVIQKCQGMANKDLSKFADQINALCDKWDR